MVGVPNSAGVPKAHVPVDVMTGPRPCGSPKLSPGGNEPVTIHEPGELEVCGFIPNATAIICEPSVTVSGLGVLVTSVYRVAPAKESTAPRAAADTAAALMTAPIGDSRTYSNVATPTRTAGVLCRNARRRAAGTLIFSIRNARLGLGIMDTGATRDQVEAT
jgi:hypothetical protein